jgi:hypothetical protein
MGYDNISAGYGITIILLIFLFEFKLMLSCPADLIGSII